MSTLVEAKPTTKASGASRPSVEERRASVRLSCAVPVEVRGAGGPDEVIEGTAENVNEGGLFMRSATELGLALGDRCELTFPKRGSVPQLGDWVGVPVYATVIRTQPGRGSGSSGRGVGLRFDQPLVF